MAAETSDLPIHYGGKTSTGEIVQRPVSPLSPTSPTRSNFQSFNRAQIDDRERLPPADHHYSSDNENGRGAGLRRRPSNQPNQPRRHSHGDYEGERPSFQSEESKRRLRDRARGDDFYFRDDEREYYARRDDFRHPDNHERSRPPRAYRNYESFDRSPAAGTKPTFDETRSDYRDLEKGRAEWSPEREAAARGYTGRQYDEVSIDGYAYEGTAHQPRTTLDFKSLTPQERAEVLRLPWTQWMHSEVKNNFVASIGEFVGTTMFLFFAFAGTGVANIQSAPTTAGGQGNSTTGNTTGFSVSKYLYIAICFGFSLMVNVWVFFRISGGLFNPAVTLAMVLVGAIKPVRAACLFVAQICGAIAASAMVLGVFPTELNVRTTLGPDTSLVRGVFIEALLTAELVFTIFMLAKEKHKATFIAPVGIGLALFIAELVGVYYTGGSLNPARSFGPCVVTTTFDREHWIYWVGPIIGSLIAVFFYKFIKMLEYEMANPGQDGDDKNDPTKNPTKRAAMIEERNK